jgi:hypothetical protein
MRIFIVLSLSAIRAWCCSCAGSPVGNPPCQSAWQYDAVFTGTVESIAAPATALPFPQRQIRLTVAEPFRGIDPGPRDIVIETGLGGGDCGYNFERGRQYIIYASKRPGGALSTGICSPTRPVEDAEEDLKYLRGLPKAPPTAEIRVTAYDPQGNWSFRPNGPPEAPGLAGVTVTIDGPGVHQSATTGASGRHVFSGLPAGEYKVSGSLENYVVGNPLRPVRAHAKGCAEVPLPMQLDRTVTGRVLDPNGMPVAGITVEAVPATPRNENDLPFAADTATSDANGRYELRHLAGGDYFLGVSLTRPPTREQPYTRWFYPGTEDPARAVLVHVLDKPGSQRFDVTLPPAQHDRTVRGTVYWPDGRPAENINIVVQDPRWPWFTGQMSARTGKDGQFTVQVLDGTAYRLHAVNFANPAVSAVPAAIAPGGGPPDLRLVLTQKGNSLAESRHDASADWRKGLGIR